MARQRSGDSSIPTEAQKVYYIILSLIDDFCGQYLNEEYRTLCRRLATELADKEPRWLARGKPEVWASTIVRVIAWVNFLGDISQTPHLKLTIIDEAFNVPISTSLGKAKIIRDRLGIRQHDFRWMLRQQIEQNPMVWMIEVNGVVQDARQMSRKAQEEAFRKELIPYVPGEKSAATKTKVKK